jgi:hypothetical protein
MSVLRTPRASPGAGDGEADGLTLGIGGGPYTAATVGQPANKAAAVPPMITRCIRLARAADGAEAELQNGQAASLSK